MSGSLISLFPIGMYYSSLQLDQKFIDLIKSLKYLRVKNENGFISDTCYLLDLEENKKIKQEILDHVKVYLYDIIKIQKTYNIDITTSWANKHDPGDFSQEHNHNNSIISGIAYIDVLPDSGELIFNNPFSNLGLPLDLQVENYSQFNSNEAKIIPKNGDLFLFPSSLKHKVTINKSNHERYSIAFNVMVRGVYGFYEKELTIN